MSSNALNLWTGIILSGGKSSRMGTNKALLEVRGDRLIDRTVSLFRALFAEVMIVTNSPLEYLDQDVQIVTDVHQGKGPLGGIHAGLFYASFENTFVASCDMPNLNEAFIRYMMGQAGSYDIVVPQSADGLQPLHAVYAQRCLAPIDRQIRQDRLKVTGFYKGLRVLTIEDADLRPFDPEGRMFFNVNSPEDLRRVNGPPGD